MRRGRGLVTDPEKVREWQDRSRRSQALDPDERAVRDEVFARDGHRCQLRDVDPEHRCYGGLTYQHRRKAGQQGAYTVENGSTLCAHGNQQIEADPRVAELAHAAGLVVRPGDPEFDQLGRRAARDRS